MLRARLIIAAAALAMPSVAFAQLSVVSTTPALNATAATTAAVVINFDRALDTSTVDADSIRIFGQWSGAVQGSFAFSNGDQTVTVTPNRPFSAGEMVFVNLSHDLKGADTTSLRSAGYAYQFMTAVVASAAMFAEIDRFSNRISNVQTRIYGATAADLDRDGYLDLATVNEVSADVRVFLNRADGSGKYQAMLPPQDIGVEASPHATADFNNDGQVDLCISATISQSVWILLGAGDGTFSSIVEVPVGGEPHGIAPLDVDGDGDIDVVNANVGSNNLALLLNNGSGTFSAPTYFEGGVNGEYGLAAADMNGDGITDLVVGGRNGEEINTMLGNGNGTFTAAAMTPQDSGGATWVVVVGDVDGDGILDAAAANDGTGTIGILIGQGNGTFAAPTLINVGAHVPSTDLGDLDGDGDLDMVVSSFGGGFWRRFQNDGSGVFTQVEDFTATSNPSCAVVFDSDNDGDLDITLFDEIADEVILMQNGSGGPPPTPTPPACAAVPGACREPIEAGKSKLVLKRESADTAALQWKWTKGPATTKAEYGNPVNADDYALCLYKDGSLLQTFEVPAGGMCGNSECWKETTKGFKYKNKALTPDGVLGLKLFEGLTDGEAKIKLRGKGSNLGLPADLNALNGVLDVQLRQRGGGVCWGATFTPPFKSASQTLLKAASDVAGAPPLATWSGIHANVIGPVCGGCHGGSGGLSGLNDCNSAHANLVNIASTELATMDRITPGDATMSWIMHKLDGTQDWFMSSCAGMYCGAQMPLGGELAANVRDAIRAWINDGAVNDCP
jgi:hypothetical protein